MDDQRVVRGPLLRAVNSLHSGTARSICTQAVHGLGRERDGDIAFTKQMGSFFDCLGLGRVVLALISPPFSQRPVPRSLVESLDRDNPCLGACHCDEKPGKSALTVASEDTGEQQLDVNGTGAMTQLSPAHAIRSGEGRIERRRPELLPIGRLLGSCLVDMHPLEGSLGNAVDDHLVRSHPASPLLSWSEKKSPTPSMTSDESAHQEPPGLLP